MKQMNKQPVYYLQKDSRWKDKPYRVPGETSTIGSAGCGPTSAAMLIATLKNPSFTPVEGCKWAVDHGYKALKQGTYYSYFKAQFAEYGIDCDQMNWTNTYGKPNDKNHAQAFDLLARGYYLIALMGKGQWTTGGHFIVVWWEDNKVHINDPASTKTERLNGDLTLFKSQVKYYWWIDARKHNGSNDTAQPFPVSGAIPERRAAGVAEAFDEELCGTYLAAVGGLDIKNTAWSETGSMILVPSGTEVQNSGRYTMVNGVKWLYVQTTYQGVKYTGFSSEQSLIKQ